MYSFIVLDLGLGYLLLYGNFNMVCGMCQGRYFAYGCPIFPASFVESVIVHLISLYSISIIILFYELNLFSAYFFFIMNQLFMSVTTKLI